MLRSGRLLLPTLLVLALSVPPVVAQTAAEVVSQARRFLGSERDLNGVRTIRFVGRISDNQGNSGAVEIAFMKPNFHRYVLTMGDVETTTILDDLAATIQRRSLSNPAMKQTEEIPAGGVAELRAVARESLYFFRGTDEAGGRIAVHGPATIEGRETVKVDFIHPAEITFTRYFDRRTGQLILTETDRGSRVREEGELRVDGIRFPRKLVREDGAVTTTIEFETAAVNEPMSRELFRAPLLPF